MDDFYFEDAYGLSRRIPLVPFCRIKELRRAFARLYRILQACEKDFPVEWRNNLSLRNAIKAILTLNGIDSESISLEQAHTLCVGSSESPPQLAKLNCLVQGFELIPLVSHLIEDEKQESPTDENAPNDAPFPIFLTDNEPFSPRGVPLSAYPEFARVYQSLIEEIQSLSKNHLIPFPESPLLFSEQIAALAHRFVELAGLPFNRLNIHQVCGLAIVHDGNPPLLARLYGLVGGEDEKKENEHQADIPPHTSLPHFLQGQLFALGVSPSESQFLMDSCTLPQLKSFLKGLEVSRPKEKRVANPQFSQMSPEEKQEAKRKALEMFAQGGHGKGFVRAAQPPNAKPIGGENNG